MRFLLFLLISLLCATTLGAHPLRPGSGTVDSPKDGTPGEYEFVYTFDVIPYVLGKKPADCDDSETYAWLDRGVTHRDDMEKAWNEAAARLTKEIRIVDAKGQILSPDKVKFPSIDDLDRLYNLDSRGMPYMLRAVIRGKLPSGPTPSVQIQMPEILGMWVIVFKDRGATLSLPVDGGAFSPAVDFPGPPVAVVPDVQALTPVAAQTPVEDKPASSGFWRSCRAFIIEGIEHIWAWGDETLPAGLDHMAFVLGICLLAPLWRQMAINVTAFTIAHSITFTLCLYGLIHIPVKLVEVLVALTLVIVALEILFKVENSRARVGTAFGFGLVHGLAFAGDLAERGLEPSSFPAVVLGFNTGVEIGHLFLAIPATLLFVKCREKPWFHKAIAIPLASLILIFGLWACCDRIFG